MCRNLISLPQIELMFDAPLPALQYLLIAGGRAPAPRWLQRTKQGRSLWAVDHGIDICRQCNILPERLLGDGDSASSDAWEWAEAHAVPTNRYPPEKDLTDTQLALKLLAPESPFLLLTGCFGGRLDHLFSTVFSCAHAKMPCLLADEQELLFPLHGGHSLTLSCKTPPKALSLLPLTANCEKVCINHMHWPLENACLSQSHPNAISNVPSSSNPITVSVGTGILGIYLDWGMA